MAGDGSGSTRMNVVAQHEGVGWMAYNADNIEVMRGMPERSVDLVVSSIPFASLLTYSASERDFGNTKNHDEFFEQFGFFVRELLRVTKPGRLAAIHCMNLPSSKTRDGYIGLVDFRGNVIRAFQDGGWIYHSEVCIWKDPIVAAQRTKAIGLLYKQLRKDSCLSRMGIPDYLCVFRRPGENAEAVAHTHESFPLPRWQTWASPCWTDINQSNTLSVREAREDDDQKHLCALQLDVIERAVTLWSNPGNIVFDPFGGIGSTGYQAILMGRRAVICELKTAYYTQAVANLHAASKRGTDQVTLNFGAP